VTFVARRLLDWMSFHTIFSATGSCSTMWVLSTLCTHGITATPETSMKSSLTASPNLATFSLLASRAKSRNWMVAPPQQMWCGMPTLFHGIESWAPLSSGTGISRVFFFVLPQVRIPELGFNVPSSLKSGSPASLSVRHHVEQVSHLLTPLQPRKKKSEQH
jgi:hypothetical protein